MITTIPGKPKRSFWIKSIDKSMIPRRSPPLPPRTRSQHSSPTAPLSRPAARTELPPVTLHTPINLAVEDGPSPPPSPRWYTSSQHGPPPPPVRSLPPQPGPKEMEPNRRPQGFMILAHVARQRLFLSVP